MSDFEERMAKFIEANINSDKCDLWIEVLRLEFGGEAKFCKDPFINAVNQIVMK